MILQSLVRAAAMTMFIVWAIAQPSQAQSHDIPWPRGASRQEGFGHCAKGPCMKRSSFAGSVPHRHAGPRACEGKGAAGYKFGSPFSC